jgi:thymidine kinase
LGGLTRPKSIDLISRSEDITELDNKGPINRSLFNTISSGSIKTRINIATQSKKVKTDERINYKVIKFSEETELVKS